MVPSVKRADAAGIPVVAFSMAISDEAPLASFVGADDVNIGREQGEMLAQALKGKGNVALMTGILGSGPQLGRSKGIHEALANYPDIKIVEEQPNNWANDKTISLTQDWLAKYPAGQLNGVVAQGPEIAAGARLAHSNGRNDIAFIGCDYPADAHQAIENGVMYGTIDQSPALMAEQAIDTINRILNGESVEKEILIDTPPVTRTNVAECRLLRTEARRTTSIGAVMTTSTTTEPLLKTTNLCKFYGGVKALSGANITVGHGEHIAIMGDNGAGKSTFVKILSGAQPATDGTVMFDGQKRTFGAPIDSRNAGIETVYQDLSLADDLDVLSNLFLGREERYFTLGGLSILNRRKMGRRATELLSEIGVNVPRVHRTVKGLSGRPASGHCHRESLRVGFQVDHHGRAHPALGLQETGHVHEIIRNLKAKGVAVIIVSHNMQQVLELTDRVYVFRRGEVVGCRTTRRRAQTRSSR